MAVWANPPCVVHSWRDDSRKWNVLIVQEEVAILLVGIPTIPVLDGILIGVEVIKVVHETLEIHDRRELALEIAEIILYFGSSVRQRCVDGLGG